MKMTALSPVHQGLTYALKQNSARFGKENHEENPLIIGIRSTDPKKREAAFMKLTRHAPVVGRLHKMLHNPIDVENALQAARLNAWRKLGTLTKNTDHSLQCWFGTIAIREGLQLLKKKKHSALSLDALQYNEIAESLFDPANNMLMRRKPLTPESEAILQEERKLLQKAILMLPEIYRMSFERHADDDSNEEAAQKLGISVKAHKSRLHRAKEMLKEILAPPSERKKAG